MVARKLIGPDAGVRKYDLLTALAVTGLAGSPLLSTSMTRLIALITARYNWQYDEVSIGQADLALLWNVDLRTVKREIKRLRDIGVLAVKKPGVRGRVAVYALDHDRIREMTEPHWPAVGSDYVARMRMMSGAPVAPTETTVVPFPRAAIDAPSPETQGTEWGRARQELRHADTARFTAWYAPLQREVRDGPLLVLRAPSTFHADYVERHLKGDLVRAVSTIDPTVQEIAIRVLA